METFFKTWAVMRVARLLLALVAFGMAFTQRESMFAMLGGILLLQAVFNIGCVGGTCATPRPRRTSYKSASKIKELKSDLK